MYDATRYCRLFDRTGVLIASHSKPRPTKQQAARVCFGVFAAIGLFADGLQMVFAVCRSTGSHRIAFSVVQWLVPWQSQRSECSRASRLVLAVTSVCPARCRVRLVLVRYAQMSPRVARYSTDYKRLNRAYTCYQLVHAGHQRCPRSHRKRLGQQYRSVQEAYRGTAHIEALGCAPSCGREAGV